MAGDTEFFLLYEEELGGTRPDRLYEVRPQARDQRRTVAQIAVYTLIVPSLDVPVPQRYADSSILLFPSRLSTCPRSPLPASLAVAVCVSRSRRRNSWWKCRRSILTPRCTGLWSRTWTFQFLMVVIASVVVFSVYTQDRVQQRLVEHGIFHRVIAEFFILHRRLPVCWVRQINGVFALSALGVGTAPRVEPIHAGGSAGGFLHGCSWCVDAFSRWLVETSGWKLGRGPRHESACVCL